MSVRIKIAWNKRTGHVHGYNDTNGELCFIESFSANSRREFKKKVNDKIKEFATITKTAVEAQ